MKKSTKNPVIVDNTPEIVESSNTPDPIELVGNRFDYFVTSVYKAVSYTHLTLPTNREV